LLGAGQRRLLLLLERNDVEYAEAFVGMLRVEAA
jgi:hypothetical protein